MINIKSDFETIEMKSLTVYRYFKEINGVLSHDNKPQSLLQALSDKKFNEANYVLAPNSPNDTYEFKYFLMRGAIFLLGEFEAYDTMSLDRKKAFASFFNPFYEDSPMFKLYYEQLKIENIINEKKNLEKTMNNPIKTKSNKIKNKL